MSMMTCLTTAQISSATVSLERASGDGLRPPWHGLSSSPHNTYTVPRKQSQRPSSIQKLPGAITNSFFHMNGVGALRLFAVGPRRQNRFIGRSHITSSLCHIHMGHGGTVGQFFISQE